MGQNNSLGDAELTLFSRRSPLKPGKEREIQKESGAERAISKGAGYNISERGTRNGETPAGHGQRQRDGDGSEKSVQQPQAGELEQADSDGGWYVSPLHSSSYCLIMPIVDQQELIKWLHASIIRKEARS